MIQSHDPLIRVIVNMTLFLSQHAAYLTPCFSFFNYTYPTHVTEEIVTLPNPLLYSMIMELCKCIGSQNCTVPFDRLLCLPSEGMPQ